MCKFVHSQVYPACSASAGKLEKIRVAFRNGAPKRHMSRRTSEQSALISASDKGFHFHKRDEAGFSIDTYTLARRQAFNNRTVTLAHLNPAEVGEIWLPWAPSLFATDQSVQGVPKRIHQTSPR